MATSTNSSTTTTTSTLPRSQFLLHRRRRLSIPSRHDQRTRCQPLPHSIEALDLSASSPTQNLASLRLIVLNYLTELETRLTQFQSPDFEAWKAKGETTIEEARQRIQTSLDLLHSIRHDVCSHLPDFHLNSAVEGFVNSFPDVRVSPVLNEMRSHLPDMPQIPHLPDVLPDMQDVRNHLHAMPTMQELCSKLDDIRNRLHDLDFHYIPVLSSRLQNLRSHLASIELPDVSNFAPTTMLSDVLDSLLSSELVSDLIDAAHEVKEGEEKLEKAALDIAHAVKRSLQGSRLIAYTDLPHQWRNNHFVVQGYRFIPIERWPLIIMSVFAFHNETMNIHTHLIPFTLWGLDMIPFGQPIKNSLFKLISLSPFPHTIPSSFADLPEQMFMAFALLCLFTSAVWHTMAGCAHEASMDFCARVDYVGIGWLISASVATVVYYGFQCRPEIGYCFLAVCLLTGLAGNIFPFMKWFNQLEYRGWRIVFFLTMAFSAIAPLATLSMVHSTRAMFSFILPVTPSFVSYLVGLAFYALHIPERFIPEKVRGYLDLYGIGSHCIWHCFIVLAVSQHKAGMAFMRQGMECPA